MAISLALKLVCNPGSLFNICVILLLLGCISRIPLSPSSNVHLEKQTK